jgi:photosystem II stability/assembly factor-like uncharacterized protein
MKRIVIAVLTLLLTAPLLAASRRRASLPKPLFPQCSVINGTPAVTFTRDEGASLTPVAQRLSGIGYTYGLTALDTPGAMLSWHKSTLSLSQDYGCSWTPAGDFNDPDLFPPRVVAAKGGRAYAWSDNRVFLLRYDSRGATTLKSPGTLIGLGVDRADGLHVRVMSTDGLVSDSRDGGDTWTTVGVMQNAPPFLYRAYFDPADLDHIVAGGRGYVSRDGGKSWSLATVAARLNVYEVMISPVDGNTVWAEALDFNEERRHIYLSRDGGATYKPVVDAGAGVQLINGNIMAAHPRNANIVYFVFGSHFQGYGTDLFRYDDGMGTLSVTHNAYDDINAIAFLPDDPSVIYLGLETEQGTH